MIEITREPNADSRTANKEFSKDTLHHSTEVHIDDVKRGMEFFAKMLTDAGKKHDNTKLSNFNDFFQALNAGNVKESNWYHKHITEERHHLVANVPNDVTLIDVIEHLVDCVMAGMSRSGTVYDIDLPDNVLQLAQKNTVELLKKNVKIVEDKNKDDILNSEISE